MRFRSQFTLFLLPGCISIHSLYAQTSIAAANGQMNTITTAASFLRISPDARAGGMGETGIATDADANSQFWNLAKVPLAATKYGVSLTYTPWLRDLASDMSLSYISGFYKFGKDNNQAVTASFRYMKLGELKYLDENANLMGTGKPNEYAADLGYAAKFSECFSAGISVRYIHSAIGSGYPAEDGGISYKPGNALAADLGFLYRKTNKISDEQSRTLAVGLTLTNLGTKIAYSAPSRIVSTFITKDYIPANLGVGAAYTFQEHKDHKLTLAADFNKLLVPSPLDSASDKSATGAKYYYPDKPVLQGITGSFSDAPGGFSEEIREIQVSAGAEYWYKDQFALRAGYFYEDKTKGGRKYFTVGAGIRYNIFNLNASYVIPSGSGINRNPLANTVRCSLILVFNGKQNQ